MGKLRKAELPIDEKYNLPTLEEISCPVCEIGTIKITRTLHRLPDGEEILILLMECESCFFKRNDVIPLNTAFQPGKYTLHVMNGDLTAKIFRSPTGLINLPEADFEIEPGTAAEYFVTNVEGILNRMIQWTQVMLAQNEDQEHVEQKIRSTLKILSECKEGMKNFTLILTDLRGGSYISTANADQLEFEPMH